MLVKDIVSCKDCPIYMKICPGNKDILMSHCIEPPCVYLNEEDDMEREVGAIIESSSLSQIKPRQQPTATKNTT